ncbi:PrcB C-terminal [Anaerovirgula multivorans]|uniref:PrcB C-terminal n=1 Tax=Anaerovirgula multivorans TaxID=312168 RepID=A0A239DC73_9FIRM|nr:stalk domain-containing protein [Anaerovirgula multivorans]SNS29920.1 PrcB C-terminal [Anaerovirgula multivorans]
MIKSKFTKVCVVGICLTTISSSAVFANSENLELRTSPSIEVGIESQLTQKHREIDKYIFEENSEKMAEIGFTVTHTGPREDYIEIGVTPYSEENADFLYEIFGKDSVKIVEGQQAYTLKMWVDSDDSGVNNTDNKFLMENRIIKDRDIRVQVDGEWLETEVAPFIENNRTLVPLKGIMEKLGATVEWDQDQKAVKVLTEDMSIVLAIGKDTAEITKSVDGVVNVETLKLEVPAKVVEGRTFIPGRFVAETLGASVGWDDSNRAVTIETEGDKDVIIIEKPIHFEIVEAEKIDENQTLSAWYEENIKTPGFHTLTDGQWHYVLVTAGEKSTGGYDLQIGSVTQVTPGTAYIDATLLAPSKDEVVTQALTYPNILIRFDKDGIEKIQGNLADLPPSVVEPGQDEIGESLEEMGKAIAIDAIKEMKLYNLMQKEMKTFKQDEIDDLINVLNTSPTYKGGYPMMLAGNSIMITSDDETNIQLTSYGFEEHVLVGGQIDGKDVSYCIVSPEIGKILLDIAE